MIKIDRTRHSVVVWCTLCTPWRELHTTEVAALQAGRNHYSAHHGLQSSAGQAVSMRLRRAINDATRP